MSATARRARYALDLGALPVGIHTLHSTAGTPVECRITRPESGAFAGWTFVRVRADKFTGGRWEKIATHHPASSGCVWSSFSERGRVGTERAPLGYALLTAAFPTLQP